MSESSEQVEQTDAKEPSLGPACLVVCILTLAVFCSVCAFGSWIVFSDQTPMARKAISTQLIPWVEQSELADADKASIVAQLEQLIPQLDGEQLDRTQLLRLRNCLQDNPILLWGSLQSLQSQAESAGLNEIEQEALNRSIQRLMRMAVERTLSRRDLEFALQDFSIMREDGMGTDLKPDLSGEQIREIMLRMENLLRVNEAPNEPFELSVGEAFRRMVADALAIDDKS